MHPINKLRGLDPSLPTLHDYMNAGLKAVIILALLVLAVGLANALTTRFNDHEEIVLNQNNPFTIMRVGLLAGQVAAIKPLASAHSTDTRSDLLWLGVGGLIVVVVFNCIIRPITGLLLSKVHNANAMRTTDLAAAYVQAAFYVADGLIVWGAFSGSAPSTAIGIEAIVVFSLLGFITLGAAYGLAGKRYGLNRAVKAKNVPAAEILGGLTLSLGAILHTAVAGDFTGWTAGIIGFLVSAIIAIVVLMGLLPILDKFILPKVKITNVLTSHNGTAAAWTAAFVFLIAVSLAAIHV